MVHSIKVLIELYVLGVAGIPGCVEDYQVSSVDEGNSGGSDTNQDTRNTTSMLCRLWESALSAGVYAPWVRKHIIQAQYYKNPNQMHQYLKYNTFLKDINLDTGDTSTVGDEHDDIRREKYKRNIVDLEMFVMVQFVPDGIVFPRESAWFGRWDGERVVPLEEQDIYEELGLKQLDDSGRLKRVMKEGEHMILDEQLLKELVKVYLIAEQQ